MAADMIVAAGSHTGGRGVATNSKPSPMSTAPDQTQTDSLAGRLARSVMGLEHCLLIVRHGQTQWNLEDRMATHTDVPLSEIGFAQAGELGRALSGVRFASVHTSPLMRAILTTSTVVKHAGIDAVPIVDSRLAEPSAGPFEGIPFGELERGPDLGLCDAYARYCDELDPLYPPGAEPLDQTIVRACSFLSGVEAAPGRHLAVSHGTFIRILLCGFLGTDARLFRRLKVSNCHAALLKFYPEPPHQLVAMNIAPN
jgi:probable phosphoglycerate mutase